MAMQGSGVNYLVILSLAAVDKNARAASSMASGGPAPRIGDDSKRNQSRCLSVRARPGITATSNAEKGGGAAHNRRSIDSVIPGQALSDGSA